jgi:AraC family transcriptional regulator
MLLNAASLVTRLQPGRATWTGGASAFTQSGPGEAPYTFDRLSVGVFLKPLPSHRTRRADERQIRNLPIAAGHGWIFPAGFEGWCAWGEANDFLSVEIDAALLAGAGEDAVAQSRSLRPLQGTLDPATVSLALQIHAAGSAAPRLYRETLTAALAASALSYATSSPAQQRDPRLQRAIDLMEARLAEDVSLDELAAAAAMSPFHFARAFKAALGRAPHQELVHRRIERAKALVLTTKLPISDIAFQVGWRDVSRFTATFKRLVGATPGAWRAR